MAPQSADISCRRKPPPRPARRLTRRRPPQTRRRPRLVGRRRGACRRQPPPAVPARLRPGRAAVRPPPAEPQPGRRRPAGPRPDRTSCTGCAAPPTVIRTESIAGVWLARLHHRRAVRAVTGPRRALQDARGLGRRGGHVDRHDVRRSRRRRCPGWPRRTPAPAPSRGPRSGRRQDPARGVEVPALQAGVVEERALQVVAARGRAEEPVAHQVAGADLELERLRRPRPNRGASVISSDGSSFSAATSPIAVLTHALGDSWKPVVRRAVCCRCSRGRAPRGRCSCRPCRRAVAPGAAAAGAVAPRSRRRAAGAAFGRRCGLAGAGLPCRPGRGRDRRRRRRPSRRARAGRRHGAVRSSRRRARAAVASARRRSRRRPPRLRWRRHGLADRHDVVLLRVHVHAVGVARVGRQVELRGTAVVARGRRDHHRDRGRRDGDEAADAPGTGRGVELHR